MQRKSLFSLHPVFILWLLCSTVAMLGIPVNAQTPLRVTADAFRVTSKPPASQTAESLYAWSYQNCFVPYRDMPPPTYQSYLELVSCYALEHPVELVYLLGPNEANPNATEMTIGYRRERQTFGLYKAGDIITIDMAFTEPVRVQDRSIKLEFHWDGDQFHAPLADNREGTDEDLTPTVLTFAYEVQPGDRNFGGGMSIQFPFDTDPSVITSVDGVAFTYQHSGYFQHYRAGWEQSVDAVRPTVLIDRWAGETGIATEAFDVVFTFRNTTAWTYNRGKANEWTQVEVFPDEVPGFSSGDITIMDAAGNSLQSLLGEVEFLGLAHKKNGDFLGAAIPAAAAYRVTVTPDASFNGGEVQIRLLEGATSDIAGNRNFESNTLTVTVADLRPPVVIEPPAFVPKPPDEIYNVGDEIEVTVTFDEEGVHYEGDNPPYVVLYLGERNVANARHATWQPGSERSGSTTVTFAYPIQAGDVATSVQLDPSGVAVPRGTSVRDGDGNEVAGTAPPPVAPTEQVQALPRQEETAAPFPDAKESPPPAVETLIQVYPIFEVEEPKAAASDVPRSPIVFNELGNGSGDADDWLELRNVTGSAVSLKDWELSIVQDGKKEDTSLIMFPDASVPANGLLLITNSDPTAKGNALAGGDNVATAEVETKGSSHLYLVNAGLSLPDDGKFLLILRNAKEKLGLNEAFVDVAGGGGSDTDAFVREQTGDYDTHVWPLQVLQAPGGDTEDALGSGKVWQRANAGVVGYHKDAWAESAFTGIGYDRKVTESPATAGTPGYPNGAVKTEAATPKGSVTLSEIMFDSGGGTLPQWIELYNNSKTDAINLNRWELEIQNVDSEDLIGRPIVTLTLGEKVIQPNQTLLIVAGPARASSDSYLPADRVYDLLALHEKNLRIKRARDTFLSTEGFYLQLSDRNGNLVDEVGNRDSDRRSDDAPAWALPLSFEEGSRSSVIRRYDKGVALPGRKRASWVLAARIKPFDESLHYGHADDIGTPGHREGGALPVELSSFSMTRTEAGAVVLTWTTESEVDNAGFNLRRSEKRASGFTLLNPALIAGAGTTGERQTYTFTDTSAKPGVEYYYQIEEVAFDGKPETLVTRLLPGPVSASNRMLTTFGEVKKTK